MTAPPSTAEVVRSRLERIARRAIQRLTAPGSGRGASAVQPHTIGSLAGADSPVSSYPALVAELRHLHWTPTGDLELGGWTYLSTAAARRGAIRVWASLVGTDQIWPALVMPRRDPEPNAFSRVTEDLSHSAWTATLPAATLSTLLGGAEPGCARDGFGNPSWTLQVWVELTVSGQAYRSPLTKNYRWGSANRLSGHLIAGSWWVSGTWQGSDGLVLSARTDCVVAEQVSLVGPEIAVSVRAVGAPAPTNVLLSAGNADPTSFGSERTCCVRLTADQLPAKDAADLIWVGADGSRHRVLAATPALRMSNTPLTGVALDNSSDCGLTLARRPRMVQAEELSLAVPTDPVLQVSGTLAGTWAPPLRLELRGARDTFAAACEPVDGTFRVKIPLLRSDAWGHEGLAPLPGGYRLWLVDGTGSTELVQLSTDLVDELYRWDHTERFSARLEQHPDRGGLWLMILDPRPLTEIGPYARKRLRALAQKGDTAPVEDAVYFESFVGESCACNPKAMFDEMSRRDLELRFYWGVQDLSVPVPEGATPVVINSAEWWRVRHQARYLVTNDWLGDTFKHRSHQRVLQTWHGTALKLLALDRPRSRDDAAFVRAIQAESAKWDLLLVENDYSVEQMRRAYDYEGPVLKSGYPRNDVLSHPQAAVVREQLRARMGIRADQQVILYAPTWREDKTAMVTDLDLVELARTLGHGYVILARGHAKTLRGNAELSAERVINVSSYPEASELFCAADLCITDYSSVMFDFAVTGKPLLFFTPDYDSYVSQLRGVYFDLAESAPGPLLTDLASTAEAVRCSGQIREQFDDRYRAWAKRFSSWDDGAASTRAVDALLALSTGP